MRYAAHPRIIAAIIGLMLLPLAAFAQAPVTLSPVEKRVFLGTSGLPLASGCVFTYIANTTTNQATYVDSGGITTNTNPVILDAAGRADIWLDTTKAYKFKVVSAGGVNCASGVTQYTVDNITALSASSILGSNNVFSGNNTFSGTNTFSNPIIGSITGNAATASVVATATSATNITGPGAISGTFSGNATLTGQTTLTNPCSIDGLIYVSAGGCYTGLQAAITALGGVAGTIIVPPGTFSSASTITMTTGSQHIICSGMGSTVISYTGGATTAIVDIGTASDGSANKYDISIEGCTITGNASVVNAIRTRGVHHSSFKNLSLRNVTGAALLTNFAVTNVYENIHTTLNDGAFTTQPTTCIQLDGPDASHKSTASAITNPVCEGVSGTGIVLGQAIEITITGGTSEQNARGLNMTSTTENTTVIGTDFEANSTEDILTNGIGLFLQGGTGCLSGVKLHAGATSQITSIQFSNNTCTATTVDVGAIQITYPAGLMGGGTSPSNLQFLNSSTTCTTGAAVGAICTTGTITFPVAYPDTNYRIACTGLTPTNVPIVQTIAKSSASFTITIAALTAAAATFAAYDCVTGHN